MLVTMEVSSDTAPVYCIFFNYFGHISILQMWHLSLTAHLLSLVSYLF